MAILVNEVSYVYPDQQGAIEACSFVLENSTISVVLGSNGCGKSTLLKLLSADLKAQSGKIVIDGCDIQDLTLEELARKRAVLPQQSEQHFLFPVSVKNILLLACYKKAGSGKAHEEIILEVSQILELESLLFKNYQHLSGGEKQRVQLARVLVQIWPQTLHDTEQQYLQQHLVQNNIYLLLDEPCSALDMYYSHYLLDFLKRLCNTTLLKNRGITVSCFVVLHDINLALRYADNVLLMKSGRLIAQGTVKAVLTQEHIQNAFSVTAKLHFRDDAELNFIETGL